MNERLSLTTTCPLQISLKYGRTLYIITRCSAIVETALQAGCASFGQKWKTRTGRQYFAGDAENAGVENEAPDCRGGKRGSRKRGTRLQGWKTRE